MTRLGSDVVSLIAEQLYNAEDHKTLASLRLTSRESNLVAKPWLFRSLNLNFGSLKLMNKTIDSFIASQNNLASYVRELIIRNNDDDYEQKLFDQLDSILTKFPAVRRVIADGVMISHKLTQSLCKNQKIHEFQLYYSMVNEDWEEEIELEDNGDPFPPELVGSTKLTSLSINYDYFRNLKSSLLRFQRLLLEASSLRSLEINFKYFDSADMIVDFVRDRFLTFSNNETLPPLESLTLHYYDLRPIDVPGIGRHLQWSFLRDLTIKMFNVHHIVSFLDVGCTMPLSLRSLCLQQTIEKNPSYDWHKSLITFLNCFKGLRSLEIANTSVELGTPGLISTIINHSNTLQILKIYNYEKWPQEFPIPLENIIALRDLCPQIQELKLHLHYNDILADTAEPPSPQPQPTTHTPSHYQKTFQTFPNLRDLRIFTTPNADTAKNINYLRCTQAIHHFASAIRSPRLQTLHITVCEIDPQIYELESLIEILQWEDTLHAAWKVQYFDSEKQATESFDDARRNQTFHGRDCGFSIEETPGEAGEGRYKRIFGSRRTD